MTRPTSSVMTGIAQRRGRRSLFNRLGDSDDQEMPNPEPSTGPDPDESTPEPHTDDGEWLERLRQLVAEELHLLGRELNDSLAPGRARRLATITETLDAAEQLLVRHRQAHPPRHTESLNDQRATTRGVPKND